ncbi:MAG: transcription-repair coupling factor [Cytophagaceae bacterium]|nr:transcription-repair coupling factor [Cytophagaceae bacterium]MDW8455902.1 transcription-repair coupling factor [Cytophagaceae bacterium]
MNPRERFFEPYENDGLLKFLYSKFRDGRSLHITGLSGSSDSFLLYSCFRNLNLTLLYIVHDKEEALYTYDDVKHISKSDEHLLYYPASYKKAYQYEEVDNANVLQRISVLNELQKKKSPHIIITHPEAICEKVISKKSLSSNTFLISVGNKLDVSFLSEWLSSYEFEQSDFVYEPGQFSIRGGIVDVFSYSHDEPFRIELNGNEVESIRVFSIESQLSSRKVEHACITPNVQTKLISESRESFFSFLPEDSIIMSKDFKFCLDVCRIHYEKTLEKYEELKKKSGDSSLITHPERLMINEQFLSEQLSKVTKAEIGTKNYFGSEQVQFNTKPQPSFNKDFSLLTEDLREKHLQGYTIYLCSDSLKQIDRLNSIFEELDADLPIHTLNISLRAGFIDERLKILFYTDHEIFERHHRYKVKEKPGKTSAMTIKELRSLQRGDFVTHSDYGIARFAGMETREINGKQQEVLRLVFKDDDLLYINIHSLHKISKYSGKDGAVPAMSKLGSGEWEAKKNKVKKQVKDIAKELIRLYALRKSAPGFSFSPDSFLQAELESSFIYEDTPDQAKATQDVKHDMEQPYPMDRLICGDVGFGKTEVAIRAAFKAVCDNKQVAVLVPTTVLAMQHYKTFRERLKKFPCMVEYISRFKTATQIKETLRRVAEGKTNILIGTHRLIGKDVKFKDLGLLIIDEEQKFGVKVKEKLREMKVNIDTLTLTATPIPRTLHFSLMGARDLSIISTPPPNRQPVQTEVHEYNEEIIRDAIVFELKRGGQVFVVHNRVSDIEEFAASIKRLVPDSTLAIAHGQMDGEQLEKVMIGFVEGEYDILVSTNIIESGLDIPNANTIIINKAHSFGLSDLHQMRGRVGRSNKKAYCYLLVPPMATLPADARKRLQVLEEFSDLGDGFKVAMRDLDIRGAGNLLGAEQSGFINDLGFDMYHKILDEAIQELKESEFKELFEKELQLKELKALSPDCTIETDLSIIIPESYVSNITERLNLYSTIDSIKSEEQLTAFCNSLTDRFGPMPKEVEDLILTIRLRWKAEKLGFEKLVLKGGMMKGQFVPAENVSYYRSEVFGVILQYVQIHSKTCKMREVQKKLTIQIEGIESVSDAYRVLSDIENRIINLTKAQEELKQT